MIRYHKLGYVALDVTNVEKSSHFYEHVVGLKLQEKVENGAVYLRCSRDHHNIILYPSDEPGLRRIGLEVENPEQLEIAFEHFSKHGLNPYEVERSELKELKQGKSFRFKEPCAGITFEFYSDITQVAEEYQPTVSKIARLGHVVLKVEKLDEMNSFMKDVMNFRVSDYVEDGAVFMRCYPNPYHHSFAILKFQENALHHVNFMVTEIDDIGEAIHRLQTNESTIVFGPGRHEPSGSIFLYFLDPDGMTVEYSFGMETFPEEGPRKARMLDRDFRIMNKWGGGRHPSYASVGKIK